MGKKSTGALCVSIEINIWGKNKTKRQDNNPAFNFIIFYYFLLAGDLGAAALSDFTPSEAVAF